MADRGRYRVLRRGIHAYRVSWGPELVSQYRPQLGTPRALCWGMRDRAGALHRRRPGPGGRFPRYGPAHSQPVEVRPPPPEDAHAPWLRSLDAAGAATGS